LIGSTDTPQPDIAGIANSAACAGKAIPTNERRRIAALFICRLDIGGATEIKASPRRHKEASAESHKQRRAVVA
jgi:hypothetical protein